jgi:hypothetical protein
MGPPRQDLEERPRDLGERERVARGREVDDDRVVANVSVAALLAQQLENSVEYTHLGERGGGTEEAANRLGAHGGLGQHPHGEHVTEEGRVPARWVEHDEVEALATRDRLEGGPGGPERLRERRRLFCRRRHFPAEHALAGGRESPRDRRGDAGLADPALAGHEDRSERRNLVPHARGASDGARGSMGSHVSRAYPMSAHAVGFVAGTEPRRPRRRCTGCAPPQTEHGCHFE